MTIREIASIAGVSPATVSLVLNNKKGVGAATRIRVRRILDEYGYILAQSAKKTERCSIQFIKYRTHGMAVEENQGFIASIIDQVESECRHFSYDLVMRACTAKTVEAVFRDIAVLPPDGIILLGTEFDREYFHLLQDVKVPIVVLDNSMRYEAVDSVVMDNAGIAGTAVRYLHELGHRKIGYLKTSVDVSNLRERYMGYLDALEALCLTPPEPVRLTPTLNGAYRDMKDLLAAGEYKPGGAVFADNDSIAIGASRALQEAGYRIPQDISIIGVDDIPYSSVTMPALTTMRVSRSTLGILVVDIIRKRMIHPDWPAMQLQINGQLIVRDSTAPA